MYSCLALGDLQVIILINGETCKACCLFQQVEVIGSGTIVTGLKLTLVDDSILSVGDVAGDSLDTLEAPANSYLMSLKASVYDQGVVEGLTASFGSKLTLFVSLIINEFNNQ